MLRLDHLGEKKMEKDQAQAIAEALLEPARRRQAETIRMQEERRQQVLAHSRRVAFTFFGMAVGGLPAYYFTETIVPAALVGAAVGLIVFVASPLIERRKNA
jgi:hypothetical protein